MASIYKRKKPPLTRKPGSKKGTKPVNYESWTVEMMRRHGKERKVEKFRATFATKEEAEAFAYKWEPVFLKKGKKAVKYNSLEEYRKRRFGGRY